MVTIAVDIGGTKIATGIVQDSQPTIVHNRQVRPTRAKEGGEVVVAETIAAITEQQEFARTKGWEVQRIGVGAPGVVGDGVILHSGVTMPNWQGTDVQDRIQTACGLPTAVNNDVRVMGLGEAVYGIGADKEVLFVSIGTGIGGAIVRSGQLIDSPHFSRGEIAYLLGPTPDGGCDRIENVGSGPAMAKTYGTDRLEDVMADYRSGVSAAISTITDAMRCVGAALGGFITAYDVDAVVVGGGVGTLPEILEPFAAGIHSQLLNSHSSVTCTQATLGTNAPLVGAAHLARNVLSKELS